MKAKTFTNINFKEGRQSARRVACVFIVFTFSLAEIRLYRTVVRRRNGYSTTLRISS